jgi:hypothetical protein
MSHNTAEQDTTAFYGSVPPPPYSEHGTAVNVTSVSHVLPRPVLPEARRNEHLGTG